MTTPQTALLDIASIRHTLMTGLAHNDALSALERLQVGATAAPQEGVSGDELWCGCEKASNCKKLTECRIKWGMGMAAQNPGTNVEIFAAAPQPPASALPDTGNVGAATKDAVFQASIDFIKDLTGMEPPPIEVAPAEVFKPFHDFTNKVCALFAALPPPGRGMVPMTEDVREFIGEVADDTALNSELRDWAKRILATIAPAKRMLPLTPESIKCGIHADPSALTQGLVMAFCRGARFAEQFHGIKGAAATPLGDAPPQPPGGHKP